MLQRILVPLDGSTSAEVILSQLRRILRRHESELTLFCAQPLYPVLDDSDPERYLQRIAFQLTTEGFASQYLVRPGLAAESILETAKQEKSTLIALATHGRTGVARWVLGSVAEKVLLASPLPVLVARSFPAATSRSQGPAVRNFLVPLDGSRLSSAPWGRCSRSRDPSMPTSRCSTSPSRRPMWATGNPRTKR